MNNNKIAHSVFFWLKNSGSTDDRDDLVKGLEQLISCPLIQSSFIGLPADTQKRDVMDQSFAVSLLLFFDSEKAQDDYQTHPMHTQFNQACGHLWSRVQVYDSVNLA